MSARYLLEEAESRERQSTIDELEKKLSSQRYDRSMPSRPPRPSMPASKYSSGSEEDSAARERWQAAERRRRAEASKKTVRDFYNLGVAYFGEERYEDALHALEEAVELNSKIGNRETMLFHSPSDVSIHVLE